MKKSKPNSAAVSRKKPDSLPKKKSLTSTTTPSESGNIKIVHKLGVQKENLGSNTEFTHRKLSVTDSLPDWCYRQPLIAIVMGEGTNYCKKNKAIIKEYQLKNCLLK